MLIDFLLYFGHPSTNEGNIFQNFFVFRLVSILEHIGHDTEKPG